MCYGVAGGNGRRALRMYQEWFPNRNHPHHTMFVCLYQRLREDGSLRPWCIGGRPHQTRTPAFEEEVLERVGNDPSTSTHAVSLARTKPSCIPPPESTRTGAQRLHTSCSFCPVVYATEHREFCLSCISLFTDEVCFTRDGYFNSRNSHIWDDKNPHAVFIRVHQARFNVDIWGGILGGYLLGPVIIPDRLNGAAYLEFLQNMLPLLLEEIPLVIRRKMWFQHGGTPAHFSLQERAHLNRVYRDKWIRRGGPVAWSAR